MGVAAVIAVAGGVHGSGDEGASGFIGKSTGSVTVGDGGASFDGGSSVAEAAMV